MRQRLCSSSKQLSCCRSLNTPTWPGPAHVGTMLVPIQTGKCVKQLLVVWMAAYDTLYGGIIMELWMTVALMSNNITFSFFHRRSFRLASQADSSLLRSVYMASAW